MFCIVPVFVKRVILVQISFKQNHPQPYRRYDSICSAEGKSDHSDGIKKSFQSLNVNSVILFTESNIPYTPSFSAMI